MWHRGLSFGLYLSLSILEKSSDILGWNQGKWPKSLFKVCFMIFLNYLNELISVCLTFPLNYLPREHCLASQFQGPIFSFTFPNRTHLWVSIQFIASDFHTSEPMPLYVCRAFPHDISINTHSKLCRGLECNWDENGNRKEVALKTANILLKLVCLQSAFFCQIHSSRQALSCFIL